MTSPGIITFLKAVLEASWQGSLVILLILLVRPLLGFRVPARWRCILWSLVLVRLLVPAFVLPRSPVSLQNIAMVERPIEHVQASFDRAYPDYLNLREPGRQGQEPDHTEVSPSAPTTAPRRVISWWQVCAAVWFTGAALFATWIIVAGIRMHGRLRREEEAVPAEIETIWKRCCQQSVLSHSPRLLMTRFVDSPALIGVLRPALLVPVGMAHLFSPEDWEHVFMHELAHYRRRDHWMQALQLTALCVHWFNPLVWLGFRFLRADRELATDEMALGMLAGDRAAAYGGTLLKILSGRPTLSLQPGMVGIMENGAQLKLRIRRIVIFGPRRMLGSAAGLIFVIAFTAAVLGRQMNKPDMSAYPDMKPADILFAAAAKGDLAIVRKVLEDGLDINTATGRPEENKTALVSAAAANQIEVLRFLVKKGAQINPQKTGPSPALTAALQNGWLDCADYLLTKGATSDALMLAAAKGDHARVSKALEAGEPDFERLRLSCEIAAVNGRRDIFVQLYDAMRATKDHVDWTIGEGVVAKTIAHGHRQIVEEMIKRDSNLHRGGVTRYAAAAAKTRGMREWLISKDFKVAEYTDNERLIDATEQQDLAEMERLIKAGADVNYSGEAGWTPLAKAAAWGKPKAVKLLLEHKANPNSVKSPGSNYTALCLAKTPEIADMLFAAGASVNAKLYERDVHIITYCVKFGPKEMVQWFIDHGVDPAKVKGDDPDMSPTLLFEAGKPGIAETLIQHGVDINAPDEQGITAMFRIEQMARDPAKIVEVLLKHGANPNLRVADGYTPLMAAPDGETVDVLVAAGADINAKDDRGTSVAAYYVPGAKASRLEALRRHGLKPDANENAALFANAINRHRADEVENLLRRGVDPNIPATEQSTGIAFSPLTLAISSGKFGIAALLRKAGANDVGKLSEAAAMGDLAQMKALIDAGANVDECSFSNDTPLSFAVHRGQAEAVGFLLDHEANMNIFNVAGMTPYCLARLLDWNIKASNDWSPIEKMNGKDARKAIDAILALFKEHKPDVNYKNGRGETALFPAAAKGNTATLGLFIEQGANINLQRPDGMTPLMLAIATQPKNASRTGIGSITTTDPKTKAKEHFSARGEFVKTLLEKGADLTLRNKAGKTATDLARENGNKEILDLMESANKPAPHP